MQLSPFTLAAAAILLAAPFTAGGAQTSAPKSDVPASTRAGVYSTEQAARGRNVYAEQCSACHSTSTHSGAPFMNRWGGRPIAELYALISETMPQMDPASLTKEQYTEVTAYLLQINKMPAGKTQLPADTAVMRKIRIDSASAKPEDTRRRRD